MKTWVEDFVDEDTGEVVSIERNEIIIDRETVLEERHIDDIIESGAKSILIHKDNQSGTRLLDRLQHPAKRPLQLGKRSCGLHLPPAA